MTSHLNVHFVVARRHKYSVLVLGFAYYNFFYQLELTIKMYLIAVFARGFSIIVSMSAFLFSVSSNQCVLLYVCVLQSFNINLTK